MHDVIRTQLESSIAVKMRTLALADVLAESAAMLIGALKAGHKILVCGNGGSASDAQHFATELMGRFETERVGLPCLALTTDTSMLTAWSNDYGFETVFARQVRTLGAPGDVLVGITTSGNSPSILRAMEAAAERGMGRISLTGRSGGTLAALSGICHIVVPSDETSRIQEVHITIVHIWAKLIDAAWQLRDHAAR